MGLGCCAGLGSAHPATRFTHFAAFSGSIFNAHEGLRPSAWTEATRKGVVNTGLGETVLPIFKDEDAKVLEASVSLSWETLMMALWLLGLAAMSLRLGACFSIEEVLSQSPKMREWSSPPNFKDVIKRYGVYANAIDDFR